MLKLEHTTNTSWLCDACDRAPAAFFCKADSASLCCACDVDIHSANPLARRHHRVPIGGLETTPFGEDEEAASWLLLKNDPTSFCGDGVLVDQFLDLDTFNNNNNNNNQFINEYDSVVPIQVGSMDNYISNNNNNNNNNNYESSSCTNGNASYNYSAASISHSVSLSHLDIGIVPESTTMSENSISHTRPPKGTIDHLSSPLIQIPTQLSPMDREARVLRYREKKKARKFEKTIRYASRKAYAETRPRIKGRFAKRTGVAEVEVDQMFSSSLIAESGYGIVPSF